MITRRSLTLGVLVFAFSFALGQSKETSVAKASVADSSKSLYNYYFVVDVSDGITMDQIWSGFTNCLRTHRYESMRGTYVWGPGGSPEDDAIPSDGAIDKEGTDAIVGPFPSKQALEDALENVRGCLNVSAHKQGVDSFSQGLAFFKLKK